MIYLDNAGTTRINGNVLNEMIPYLEYSYGNPGSVHKLGVESKKAIDLARERVAKLINADPDEIIFTSGGSEANNLMVHSMSEYLKNGFPKVVSSLTEHDSMLHALEHFNGEVELIKHYYPVECCQEIAKRGTKGCDLVSMMFVNNELGFCNPVYELGKMADKYGFFFITDCVQALGHEYIDVKKMNCDMMSLSAHKINGPKGTGALFVRKDMQEMISPLIYGGSNQEFGLRGGTENVAGIVGFGKACELQNVDESKIIISSLRKTFLNSLKQEFTGKNYDFCVNFDEDGSKIISLTFPSIDAETLVLLASSKEVYISAGSACKSLEQKPNEVLLAAGLTENEARSTVRISLSCYNTIEEIISASKIICECVCLLLDFA